MKMDKFQKVSTLVFSITLMIVGILQILSSLYLSGLIMILAGVIIVLMRNKLKKQEDKTED